MLVEGTMVQVGSQRAFLEMIKVFEIPKTLQLHQSVHCLLVELGLEREN